MMNKYASNKANNSHYVEYRGDISASLHVNERKSVDRYIITEGFVKFSKVYYAEEIDEVSFKLDLELIHEFFGRKENSDDFVETLYRFN